MDYLHIAFLGIILVDVFEVYLELRQYFKYQEKEMPPAIRGIIQEKTFNEAQAYGRDKLRFGLFQRMFLEVFMLYAIYTFLPRSLWDWSGRVLEEHFWRQPVSTQDKQDFIIYELMQSAMMFHAYNLLTTVIDLPFSLYSTFVIEERHGFNKSTLVIFFKDIAKSWFLTLLLATPILMGFITIVKWGGDLFWLYALIGVVVVYLIMMTIFPTFIQPLFNTFEPLKEGELRTQIEELAKRLNFPLAKLLSTDTSTRSHHSNAYQFGFGKNKRIVISDTLLNQIPEEKPIVAIVAHELGHWAHSHVLKLFFFTLAQMAIIFFNYGIIMNTQGIFDSFGFDNLDIQKPVLIGFFIFSLFWNVTSVPTNLLTHYITRTFEFQADRYAVELEYGEALKEGLTRVYEENKSGFNPDPLYATVNYSHPTFVERLQEIDRLIKRSQ